MFNKISAVIIAFIAAAVLVSGCSTANAEYRDEPQNAAQGGAADGGSSTGGVSSTVFSNGGVQIDHPDEGYVEYIPPQNTSSEIDPSETEELLGHDTVRVTEEELADIAANTSYGEILEKLGKTQAFGQFKYRQYVTEDDRIIQLYFESKDELCPYSGAELYDRALPLKYGGDVPAGMIYGILGRNGGFFTHYDTYNGDYTDRITGDYLITNDAEIVFEDGSPATADDMKPDDPVLVRSDYALYSYPEQRHCTKIIILK